MPASSEPSSSTRDVVNAHGVALVTGGTRGLGRALVRDLLERGWTVVTDGRDPATLDALVGSSDHGERLVAVAGDVTDADHRSDLEHAVEQLGRLDVLVNNASTLGTTPLPALADQTAGNLSSAFEVNVLAPHALTTSLIGVLRASNGAVVNITSDAAIEGYPGWGAYGVSKAALEQWSSVLAAEEPVLDVYWVDPGDLRTDLHQAAFPGEDISDRPGPATVVPAILSLLDRRPASGRYRAADLAAVDGVVGA